jgi:hypothetical protein
VALLPLAIGCAPFFRDAETSPPASSAADHLARARELASAGRYDEACALAQLVHRSAFAGSSLASEARELLLRMYAEQGLVGRALDYLEPPTLEAALQVPALAQALAPLSEARDHAQAGDTEAALSRYATWLAAYGVPDSPRLRAWSDEVLMALRPRAKLFVARAIEAEEQGRTGEALHAWGLAYRYLPEADFEEQRDRFVEACAAQEPGTASPFAIDQARVATEALDRGHLAEALSAYRRAVAAAPWWAEAHHNLALLLGSLALYPEARRQMGWYQALAHAPGSTRELTEQWQKLEDPSQRAATHSRAASAWTEQHRAAEVYRSTGWKLVGWGAGLGAAAGALAWLGRDRGDQVEEGGLQSGGEIRAAADQGSFYGKVARGLGIAAGLGIAIGLPLVLLNPDPDELLVAPIVAPDAVGVQVGGSLP